MSNTFWALATLARVSNLLLDALAGRGAATLPAFPVQELVNTSWAVARLMYYHGPLQKAI